MILSNNIQPWQFIYDDAGIKETIPKELPFSVGINRHALERPNSHALCYLHKKISYRELDSQSSQLANALAKLGISKGDVVGIQMPNIPQYAVALVAISKMGATASNVSPLLAPPELIYQIKDANITALISLDAFTPLIQGISEHVKGVLKHFIVTGVMDSIKTPEAPTTPIIKNIQAYHYINLVSGQDTDFKQIPVKGEDVALLQYTGGTTGKPKGAMLTYGGLAWVAENSYIYSNIVAGDNYSASPFPMFHIAGASGVMAILRLGGTNLLLPDPRDIDHFMDKLIANPPTGFGAVPALYQVLVNHPRADQVDFSKLVLAISGAAPLAGGDRVKVESWLGENKLADFFGMTETSPNYICNPPHRSKPTTVGIPLPGVDVKIMDLDTGTKELPFGEQGEIVVNTPGLMKGYLNLPEETEKALRTINGITYMYTGDVGFMDTEGYTTICDRAKDMLIVGGYKVFSLEVEDTLSQLDFLDLVAIVGTPDEKRPGNDIVNLFAQLSPAYMDKDKAVLENDIIVFCRENMSPYKVPKRIFFVNQIPITAVGKLDKKVMREMSKHSDKN